MMLRNDFKQKQRGAGLSSRLEVNYNLCPGVMRSLI